MIPPHLLNPGFHTAGFYVADSRGAKPHYVRIQKLLAFQVVDDEQRRGGLFVGTWPGPVCPLLDVQAEFVSESPAWLAQSGQRSALSAAAVALP